MVDNMAMSIREIRREQLEAAIKICGSMRSLAERADLSPQYLSSIRTGARGLGHQTARKIEAAMNWPQGSMDIQPKGDASDVEIAYLLRVLPEEAAVGAIIASLDEMSEEGVKSLTGALLKVLHSREGDE